MQNRTSYYKIIHEHSNLLDFVNIIISKLLVFFIKHALIITFAFTKINFIQTYFIAFS